MSNDSDKTNAIVASLAKVSLTRSDGESVVASVLWQKQIAVIEFVRHFG